MKIKNIIITVIFVGIISVLGIGGLVLPDAKESQSEKRELTQLVSYEEKKQEAEKKGEEFGIKEYFVYLEKYALDQFPLRDFFRSIKSTVKLQVFMQKDNNNYYSVDGSLALMDPEIVKPAVYDAVRRFNAIYETYFKPRKSNVYYCVIPDKNYFLAEDNGYLHYDYDEFYSLVGSLFNENITEIEIKDILSADDYYKTDPHWSQDKLLPVADALLEAMGRDKVSDLDWKINTLSPYYGTYYGHLALPVQPDDMNYLTTELLENVKVYNYRTGAESALYLTEKFNDKDPYDLFLDGMTGLIKIENPDARTNKQLVVFRDSFGSSIIPLLVPEYAEIAVVDIRYISTTSPDFFKYNFRQGCDLLFLYSTNVLNTYGAFMD